MYARYRTRSRFYKRPAKVLKAYNVSPNFLRRPNIKKGLLNGVHVDETVDLRDRERLEMLEGIRHPRERDFYQDHTYHNQWIARDLEKHQKLQLASRYRFFSPNYEIAPWIWYPGDLVEVVGGEAAGQRGPILAVVKYKNEIIVQNINVRDVVIPASESRPEQVLQREHPIKVTRVRHVDPSTNEICHLELVKVRNKKTGKVEESRISLESGILLPIPPREEDLTVGDPLKDTPMLDVEEATYDKEHEMAIMVERRLRAMEDYFIETLKTSYEFHHPLRVQNGEQMQAFQLGVLERAAEKLAERVISPSSSSSSSFFSPHEDAKNTKESSVNPEIKKDEEDAMPLWWREMVEPYVELLEEEEREKDRTMKAEQQRQKEAEVAGGSGMSNDEEENEEEEEGEEEAYEISHDDEEENEDNGNNDDGRAS